MNETIKTIVSRRSTRAFKPDMPEAAVIDEIIQCALYAPSGMNTQNWHFTVVKNAGLIARMNAAVCQKLPDEARSRMIARNNGNPDFSVFYHAPLLVMVSAVEGDGGSAVNGALATQNICLAAESLGLGTCIIGMAAMVFDGPEAAGYVTELKIPEGYKPMYAVSIGYKNMEMPVPDRAPGKVTVIA